ncbi:mitochondrial carrier [Metschnikowia bicuspidata var. bicuspidata NRRL YB-4993]|uniref:Mitochondrial carrier n=1 Tax=Metschnikowia bicuspidata var. bicuspidata NRRL YB-4993 TaxID=869754 RepID=A0A1A0HJ76_9ASCO|nr:mitochondrial carrier [Metschnikowia bicuspidata var. bicuspidata NRRL YB-4993]OBA23893.1 mitochondrial carrier [Metschnikowia bicuspidata var. bicuspidata NRRL YB-4993]
MNSSPWAPRQIEVVSGLFAGFSNTIVTQPLDLLKVRLQLSTKATSQPFELLRFVIRQIHQDASMAHKAHNGKRPFSLFLAQQYYRGVGPNLFGNVSAWSLYFTLYAEFKRIMANNEGDVSYFGASALAGATLAVITNPIWLLKTRILSTSGQQENSYRSLFDGVKQVIRKEGVLTLWKGTVPSLFLVLQASLQFSFYDHTKDYLMRALGSEDLSASQFIFASVMSKITSMSLLYPTQVIRSRIQSYNPNNENRDIVGVTKKIWASERRLKGFYRGLSTNLIRVLPSTCITFLTYETTKKYLAS